MKTAHAWPSLLLLLVAAFSACQRSSDSSLKQSVVQTYADLVHASYQDSLRQAVRLQEQISSFVENPSEQTLEATRNTWIQARVPYLQTEAYRFYGGPIDDADTGPEGLINAWPMDEAYIDYVKGDPSAGIINNPAQLPEITVQFIRELNEKGGEENISAGYHAIEFLLWGQDLSPEGPGRRPFNDYTTSPHAKRRALYLKGLSQLLVQNLQQLVDAWAPGNKDNYRATFVASPDLSLGRMLLGVGSLCGAELSGERLTVAYETKEQEDEHSCFSDNTHADVLGNARGLQNVYLGRYQRTDGSVVQGPGIHDVLLSQNPELAETIRKQMQKAVDACGAIPPPFDQAILGNDQAPGRGKVRDCITQLRQLTQEISKAAEVLQVPINTEK